MFQGWKKFLFGWFRNDTPAPTSWKGIVDSLPIAVFVFDQDLRLVQMGGSLVGQFGLRETELLGRYSGQISDRLPFHSRHIRSAMAGEGFTVLSQLNSRIYETTYIKEVCSRGALQIRAVTFDQTERHRLEEELSAQAQQSVHQERLAAMGKMAAGIGHEIRNPLGVIEGWSQILEQMADKEDASPENLKEAGEMISRMVQRISMIVKSLRHFSRNEELEKLSANSFDEIFLEIEELTRGRLRQNKVEIVTDVQPGIKLICQPTRFSQVIVNLINNAIDAVATVKEPRISVSAKEINGQLKVQVTDNGAGIPLEKMEGIFKPFVSGKSKSNGNGLGLYISQRIAEEHDGRIKVQSFPGMTVFTVQVAVVPEASLANKAA